MLTLALDTTTRRPTSAAWLHPTAERAWAGDPAVSLAAQMPAGAVAPLSLGGWAPADVELLAVAVGPGSFTGLRVGIATMQGLAVALERPLIGVSSLDALAASVGPEAEDGVAVAACVDAWRGEVYVAVYRRGEALGPPAVGLPGDVLAAVAGPLLLVGDGAATHRAAIVDALGGRARFALDLVPPLASVVARLAQARGRAGERPSPADIEPVYVHRPGVPSAWGAARAR